MRAPGGDQLQEVALGVERLERLTRGRVHVERHPVVGLAAVDDQRRDREVAETRVGRRPDHALEHLGPGHLAHRHDVARARRQRDERLERREVDLLLDVVGGVGVGLQLDPVAGAVLGREEPPHLVVGREHRRGRAELCAHVRDHVAVHRREALEARARVLDDAAEPTGDVVAAEHLEDDVLGAHPVGQLPHQADTPDLRHHEVERLARHRHRDLEPARADREHAERAGRAGVAVGAEQRLAGDAEALHVDRVADAVARLAVPEAEAPARAAAGTGGRRRCGSRPAAGCGRRTGPTARCARGRGPSPRAPASPWCRSRPG